MNTFSLNKMALIATLWIITSLANQASATIVAYTDKVAWENALMGHQVLEETFDGAASDFGPDSSNNTVNDFTIDIIGHNGDPSRQGLTGNGYFAGEVDSSNLVSSDGAIIQFNYSTFAFALNGLQDDSSSSPAFNVHEIAVEILNENFLLSDLLGLTTGSQTSASDATVPFIGFISTDVFSSFRLNHGDSVRPVSSGNEAFWLDGISYASTEVPEPTTLAIFGLGLLGLASRRSLLANKK